jgi:hypothetical protein
VRFRHAGGDVFRAFDFVAVAFFKQTLVAPLLAHDLGAGLHGLAVGFLRGLARGRPWDGNAFRGGAARIFGHS